MALTEVNSLGLKNSEVKTADIADENVTLAKLEHGTSGNNGKFLRANNGADPTWETVDTTIDDEEITLAKLEHGTGSTDGKFLRSNNGADPSWETVSATDTSKMPLTGGTFTGDVTFDNQSNAGRDISWNDAEDKLKFEDDTKAIFGTGNDLQIYHNGSTSIIDSTTANLDIQSSGAINIKPADAAGITALNGGAVELYHNAVKTFNTIGTGIQVRGPEGGNCELFMYADEGDDNNDLWKWVAFHTPEGTLDLYNKTSGSWEKNISCVGDGTVELYHDNSKKFETTSTGVTITGNVAVTSGNGIDFSATAGPTNGTGSSELLDDYEEGTWSPSYNNDGAYVHGAVTVHRYIKVGNQVTVSGNIRSNENTAGNNAFYITSLPFASVDISNMKWVGPMAGDNGWSNTNTSLVAVLSHNSQDLRLHKNNTGTGLGDISFGGDVGPDANIYYTITYQAA